jgi:hypothetical protein
MIPKTSLFIPPATHHSPAMTGSQGPLTPFLMYIFLKFPYQSVADGRKQALQPPPPEVVTTVSDVASTPKSSTEPTVDFRSRAMVTDTKGGTNEPILISTGHVPELGFPNSLQQVSSTQVCTTVSMRDA